MLDEYFRSMGFHDNNGDPEFGGQRQTGEVTVPDKITAAEAGDNRLSDIQSHANRLLNLLSELRSLTHRACDAALREAECADRIEESMEIEITGLRDQLKQKDESLQAREIALAKLEETSKANSSELESRIRDKETQLQHLISERDYHVNRLNEAEIAAKQAESQSHQFIARLEELTELRLQMAQHEESLAAKELALNQVEGDFMANIQNLQIRLQDAEAKLARQETELKEKESVIQAAAIKETEIGKLIQRLSSECEKLTAELSDKTVMIARLEGKTRQAVNGGKVWNRILG